MSAVRILLVMAVFLCATAKAEDGFSISTIPDSVWGKMQGRSVPEHSNVRRNDLRYLCILHIDGNGKERKGEIICHKSIADDLIEIFSQLYKARYAIHQVRLIDEYDASDEASMEANNTSCFCYRTMTGSRTRISKHGLGLAIDVNPLYNPYVKGNRIEPASARKYAHNRGKRKDIPMKLDSNDLAVRLFKQHGFRWGGDWKNSKDYQHFEK